MGRHSKAQGRGLYLSTKEVRSNIKGFVQLRTSIASGVVAIEGRKHLHRLIVDRENLTVFLFDSIWEVDRSNLLSGTEGTRKNNLSRFGSKI